MRDLYGTQSSVYWRAKNEDSLQINLKGTTGFLTSEYLAGIPDECYLHKGSMKTIRQYQ